MLRVQQLFVRHQGQLRAFVLAIWPDFGRADDVLQEVFLTVTTKAADFQEGSNFLAWSRAITQRKLHEARRHVPAGHVHGHRRCQAWHIYGLHPRRYRGRHAVV